MLSLNLTLIECNKYTTKHKHYMKSRTHTLKSSILNLYLICFCTRSNKLLDTSLFTTQSTWTFKQIKICDSTKRSRINQLLLGAVSIYYLNEFLFLHFFHFIAFNCRICCYYSHICKRICDHQVVKSHLFLRHPCYHWPFGMSCIYIGCQHLTENNF